MTDQPQLIAHTPNPDCPACQQKRLHNPEEWRAYHSLAGSSGPASDKVLPGERA